MRPLSPDAPDTPSGPIQDALFITRDMKPKIDLETISIEIGKHVVASSPVVMACPDAYVDTSNSAESPYFSYPILGVENPPALLCLLPEGHVSDKIYEGIS